MISQRTRLLHILVGISILTLATAGAKAETVVAIGASQTYGHGVARGQDYPAQLQALLAAKGIKATVLNAGIDGDPTADMLARLQGNLKPDTKVLIIQPGKKREDDDTRKASMKGMHKMAKEHGITVLKIPNNWFKEFPRGPDGQHLTPAGYHGLALKLLPDVEAALK